MSTNARIAVIGAGMMGHAIAQVFAVAKHDVAVYDAFPASLETLHERIRQNLRDLGEDQSVVGRVRACPDMADAVSDADFIVEAAAENLEVKQKLFLELERLARREAVFASNTSVIPITRIMGGLEHRERALGTHWWNPAHLIPLVEVVATKWTDPKVVEWTLALHRAAGKTPGACP